MAMDEENTEVQKINMGICITVNVCHGPIVHDMKIRKDVFEYLEEMGGPGAPSFGDWLSNHDFKWFTSGDISKQPRKDHKGYFDEVIQIWMRSADDASMFILTFGASGTSTTWGSDL